MPSETGKTCFVEKVVHLPHADFGMHFVAFGRDNACAFLTAMLQSIEPQVSQLGSLRVPIDAHHSTLVVKFILVHRVSPHRQNSCRSAQPQ